MLQQTLGCRGCGRERVRRRRAGLGEVISGFFSITVCTCLGSCCTLELSDNATHARHTDSREGAYVERFKMLLLWQMLLRDCLLFFRIFFNIVSESQKAQARCFFPPTSQKVWNHPTFNIHKAFFQIGKSCLSR